MNLVYALAHGAVALVRPAPNFDGDLQALAALAVPDGVAWRVVELPNAPQDQWRWTDHGPLGVAPPMAQYLPREVFCVALMSQGILTEQEASSAALGAWPPTFDAFLEGKDLIDRLRLKNQWGAAQMIPRDGPIVTDLLAYLARSGGLSPDQITEVAAKIFAPQGSGAAD
jgi:hypothetical protein